MNIYVGNLAYGMADSDLEEAFGEFGSVTSATVIMDRDSGRSKGFGFVEMANDADAEQAIESLNGTSIQGRDIKVNQARPREERPKRRQW